MQHYGNCRGKRDRQPAEKGSHVDEYGIAKVIELGRLLLEQLREFGVGLYADRLHSFVDPSGQAGSLVPGKVEAAALPGTFRQPAEQRRVFLRRAERNPERILDTFRLSRRQGVRTEGVTGAARLSDDGAVLSLEERSVAFGAGKLRRRCRPVVPVR